MNLTSPRTTLPHADLIQESDSGDMKGELYVLSSTRVPLGLITSYGSTSGGDVFLHLDAVPLSICCARRLTAGGGLPLGPKPDPLLIRCYSCSQDALPYAHASMAQIDHTFNVFSFSSSPAPEPMNPAQAIVWAKESQLTVKPVLDPFFTLIEPVFDSVVPNPLTASLAYLEARDEFRDAARTVLRHWGLVEVASNEYREA